MQRKGFPQHFSTHWKTESEGDTQNELFTIQRIKNCNSLHWILNAMCHERWLFIENLLRLLKVPTYYFCIFIVSERRGGGGRGNCGTDWFYEGIAWALAHYFYSPTAQIGAFYAAVISSFSASYWIDGIAKTISEDALLLSANFSVTENAG